MRRVLLILLALSILALAPAATRAAAPVVTTSVTQAVQVNGPVLAFQHCRPELGQYTFTFDVTTVSHMTASAFEETEPGEGPQMFPPYHVSTTTTGSIVAVPEQAGDPTFTGRIGVRRVEHQFTPGQVITSSSRQTLHASDGSKVTTESIFHVTTNQMGELIVNFGDSSCSTT